MGYVIFQSRHDGHEIIDSNMLSNSTDIEDELPGFLPGDSIDLTFDVNQDIADLLLSKNHPGVSVNKKQFQPEAEVAQYEVEIYFQIVKRSHIIFRDWMSEHKMGFRSSGSTIHLEAISDEGEALFIKLQEKFNSQLDKLLFQ